MPDQCGAGELRAAGVGRCHDDNEQQRFPTVPAHGFRLVTRQDVAGVNRHAADCPVAHAPGTAVATIARFQSFQSVRYTTTHGSPFFTLPASSAPTRSSGSKDFLNLTPFSSIESAADLRIFSLPDFNNVHYVGSLRQAEKRFDSRPNLSLLASKTLPGALNIIGRPGVITAAVLGRGLDRPHRIRASTRQ